MEVHDIDYYEAHANDVKLEDITSDEDNADIITRLRDEDPEFFGIWITTSPEDEYDFFVREGDHLGWLGYFVGKSKHLETLHIDSILDNINLNAFFEGLGRNRSIEELRISVDLGESFKSLIPFLRDNDSLRDLRFTRFDNFGFQCARNIALLLDQQSYLKHLEFCETEINREGLLQITAALRSQPQLESLEICCYVEGFAALGSVLKGCLNLRKLDLSVFIHEDDDIDNEGLCALAEGLKYCQNLDDLRVFGAHGTTDAVLMSLFTFFRSDNCRLERLDLVRMNIDDDRMAILAPGLATLPSLQKLDLYGNSIGDQGIQALMGALASCNLTELHLSRNHSITANGLASLSSLLRAEHCSLCTLDLHGISIGDNGAATLANGLIGNKTLKALYFDASNALYVNVNVTSVTTRGWAAFSRLLCDSSSVNNTYHSNHTLTHLGGYEMRNTPSDIVRYLNLNESHNQAAAICKILHSHPHIDVTPFFQWKMKCLPLVVSWLEKAEPYMGNVKESTESFQRRQLSAVYMFVRSMPELVVQVNYRERGLNILASLLQRGLTWVMGFTLAKYSRESERETE